MAQTLARRLSIVVAAAALVTINAVAAEPSAGAATPTNAALVGTWVTHAATPSGAALNLIQGTPDGIGGCLFSYSGTSQPGQLGVDMLEVASNSATCQAEVATTTISTAPTDPTTDSVSGDGSAQPSATGAAAPAAAAALPVAKATIRTLWRDPADITLTEVKDTTQWSYNYTCVSNPYGWYYYHWDAYTGWSLGSNNWQNSYTCSQTTSSSYAHFHNRPFCAFSATDTYFDRTTIHGLPNGGFSYTWNSYATGQCVDLLTFEHTAYYS